MRQTYCATVLCLRRCRRLDAFLAATLHGSPLRIKYAKKTKILSTRSAPSLLYKDSGLTELRRTATVNLIVPVNSASAGLRYLVRHNVEDTVQCLARSNVRTALKQDVFLFFFCFSLFYLGLLCTIRGFGEGARAKAGALCCDMASMIVACERWKPSLEA
jgi:hypothetical protein